MYMHVLRCVAVPSALLACPLAPSLLGVMFGYLPSADSITSHLASYYDINNFDVLERKYAAFTYNTSSSSSSSVVKGSLAATKLPKGRSFHTLLPGSDGLF